MKLKAEQAIVVFVTASSEEEASRIGRRLVKDKLAACVNMLPGVRSLFWWEGKVAEERETLMILKTRASLFPDLARAVKAIHSYQVPEIVALPIQNGSADYLAWIQAVTSKPQKILKKSKKC
ncbi:MAG: divalent-cation tolerance protein CutA [Nitrospiraceae bacterium]